MKFPCPQCQQRLSAEENMVGQSLECPRCGHLLTVPPLDDTPAKPAEPEWKNPFKSADEDWVNPLKPAGADPQDAKSPGRSSAKRVGKPLQRTAAPTVIVKRSGGGVVKPLFVLTLIAAAGYGYWKYSGRTAQPIVVQSQLPTAPPPQSAVAPEPLTPDIIPPSSLESVLQNRDADAPASTSSFGVEQPDGSESKPAPEAATAPTGTAPETTASTGAEIESITMGGGAMAAPSTSEKPKVPFPTSNLLPVTLSQRQQSASLSGRKVTLTGSAQISLTDENDPLPNSVVNFASPDAWLFLEKTKPSKVASDLLPRMWVKGDQAELDRNIRIVQYGQGSVVIPHAPDYPAMTVFNSKGMNGTSMPLTCFTKYNEESLGGMKGAISSFRLKRGYMATIAQNENGTGISQNYVAQDKDIEVSNLPTELDRNVRFIRVFPWRWTSKKGIAGGIWQKLNVDWFYDWNIGANSSLDLEYVPIKQKRYWPGLNQDWKKKGSLHLLGFNEPDRPDQAKMTPDEAIAGWPELLGTGLRLGSPAVSDGGLGWLYQFMDKAEAAKLRVDFVAVHYYRATPGNDAKAAAAQMHGFLKGIHDRTKRPIWITEWNNGANWTGGGDPSVSEQKECIEEMIKMLDKTEFVERYSIYNWVEECRHVIDKNGQPTPAGVAYRDKRSPIAYEQSKR